MRNISTENLVFLIGNVTKEPQLFITQQGTSVSMLTLVVNDDYQDKDGNWISNPNYIDIKCWGNGLRKTCENYVHVGTKMYVRGKLRTRRRKINESLYLTFNEVHAEKIYILRQPTQ